MIIPPTNKFMLDTNVFNGLLDGKISIRLSHYLRLIALRIQMDELRATNPTERRQQLLAVFEEINPDIVLTSTVVFDVEGAGWDEACWSDDIGGFELMLARLRELDRKDRGLNQVRDVLIAETTIKQDAILVTNDQKLQQLAAEFGGRAIDQPEFERMVAW